MSLPSIFGSFGSRVAWIASRSVESALERFVSDGGALWLDPAAATDDSGASFVPDLTGNGNDFSQATVSARPTLTTINGEPALQGAAGGWIEDVDFVQAQPYTMYVALEMPASLGSGFWYVTDSVNVASDLVLDTSRRVAFTAGTLLTTATGLDVNSRALVRVVANTTTKITVFRDGLATLETTGSVGPGGIDRLNLLGRATADSFLGKMGIVSLMQGDYSASDDYLVTHLLDKYGIEPA